MSSPPGEQTRVTAELAGEHNHATVDLASELTGAVAELAGRVQPHVGSARRRPARWLSSPCECNHMAVQLADELTGVMVELAGELTCMTVQLSGEWFLCGIRSFVHFLSFFQ
ncbi:hypothetical protein F2Q69_00036884 [Brassica cretica]|uniref:Uncharacterized protein n=1 Tax=Brassica cretica TaxID=69181 RepID=A0A8S9SQ68_BRACR|nr:hypothetical protein F2Q69_00036884 [Brassica cretica]